MYGFISFSGWHSYLRTEIERYRKFVLGWMRNYDGVRYVVHYEYLKDYFGPPLEGVVTFLTGAGINNDVLKCLYNNSEGRFHRKSSQDDQESFDPYPEKYRQLVTSVEQEVNAEIDDCLRSGRCVDFLS